MSRKPGYLANIENIPPLIFRFQFNPTTLQDRKSFKYDQVDGFGNWGFDKAAQAKGAVATLMGFWDDVKEMGSLFTRTRALKHNEGELRVISMAFQLDATFPGPLDGDDHYSGSILPDLAILRSFMYPSWDLLDIGKMIIDKKIDCEKMKEPPDVSLSYGGLSMKCVMTDLNIKITAFKDNGEPLRAEVDLTLKEQTFAAQPIVEYAMRAGYATRGLFRSGGGTDILANLPGIGLFM